MNLELRIADCEFGNPKSESLNPKFEDTRAKTYSVSGK
jgi:hypothetical protein